MSATVFPGVRMLDMPDLDAVAPAIPLRRRETSTRRVRSAFSAHRVPQLQQHGHPPRKQDRAASNADRWSRHRQR